MNKVYGFIPAIVSGQKTIESRWYLARRAPWGVIAEGDTVYFKNSGEPITAQAEVGRVEQFELASWQATTLLKKHRMAIGIQKKDLANFCEKHRAKRYGILVYLKNPQSIAPFHISKAGLGAMSAWMSMTQKEFESRME